MSLDGEMMDLDNADQVFDGFRAADGMVRQFHEKNKVSETYRIEDHGPHDSSIDHAAHDILAISKQLLSYGEVDASLVVEEVAEFLHALYERDEVGVLDALADLEYIIRGRAVRFDLPLELAFLEVHKSNMTKERQPDDEFGARVKDKGPNYVAPNLKDVLESYRIAQFSPHELSEDGQECKICGCTRYEMWQEYETGIQSCSNWNPGDE